MLTEEWISLVFMRMSNQFEEHSEAPSILPNVILPVKVTSHTVKPALQKKTEHTIPGALLHKSTALSL